MYITEPEEILMNFLRANLTEITRSTPSISNRQVSDSQTFSGTGSQKIFTLTNSPLSISGVTIGGTTQKPYYHYNIDLDNKRIKFVNAPAGSAVVIVSYYKTATWIFPDKPREDLKRESYPRIGITVISNSGTWKAGGSTNMRNTVTLQLDILTFKDLLCTIDTETKEGEDVNRYIASKIISELKDEWDQLDYLFLKFSIINNSPAPFEPNKNIFRRILEVEVLQDMIERTI